MIKNPYEISEERNWWNQSVDGLRYAQYTLPNGCEILVGNRPDSKGCRLSFFNNIDGWLSLTDQFVHYPKCTVQWSPWDESSPPSYETIYSSLITMYDWVHNKGFKRIYIHCAAGTHRSPTMLGFYMLAFHPVEAKKISKNYKLFNYKDKDFHQSNPLEYAKKKLEDYPEKQYSSFLKILGKETTQKISKSSILNLENILKNL